MRHDLSAQLGIEFPLFAFSHCRDVVAAVTNAGGFGVLGASSHTPEQLDKELTWIDEHVGGKPYGADIIVPEQYEGKGQDISLDWLESHVPEDYRKFVVDLLAEHDIELAPEARSTLTLDPGRELLDVSLQHPIKLIANALGVPPRHMIGAGKERGIPVAALVGAKEHALKQVAADIDIIVAQGTEAGGHCGEVSTLVLVPEVIEAIDNAKPVLAAGGIVTGRQMAATVALGAAGAWTGSVWLTTEEAETAPYTVEKLLAASSRDTVRSAGRTGKPSRQLASDWTSAWAPHSDGRDPLPMPLQWLLSDPALSRVDDLAAKGHPGARALATYWVGQGVGLMNRVQPAREVVLAFIEDYLAATERLTVSLPR